MSASVQLSCDRTGRYSTCARRDWFRAGTVAEARALAARHGWSSPSGDRDYCPHHSGHTPQETRTR